MTIYKFFIPNHEWVPDPDDENLKWRGCVAVTVAETETDARANLTRYAAENGFDARWLRAARVVVLPVQAGTVASWAQI